MLHLVPGEATCLCTSHSKIIGFSLGPLGPEVLTKGQVSSLHFRLETVPRTVPFWVLPRSEVPGERHRKHEHGPDFQSMAQGRGTRVSQDHGTYRRVAASVEVSSPSILYTFPYITYSNWSALWNNNSKVILKKVVNNNERPFNNGNW